MKSSTVNNRCLLLFLCIILFVSCKETKRYYLYQGEIFHTTFHIKYEYNRPLDAEIDSVLNAFDLSMNPFNEHSIIYKVNHNIPVEVDDRFIKVFNQAQEISRQTNGAFDITCAPLVNLWGFGFDNSEAPTQAAIDSVKQFVGYNKIRLSGRKVEKEDPRVMLNASAIAKGYACDVVAEMFNSRSVINYMIEIGGEVYAKGKNPNNTCWKIEITKPEDDNTGQPLGQQAVISLCEGGLATSGNYRNYYVKDGKKYSHTIDLETGYPIENNVLSASVIMPECMLADAYATVFMILGTEASDSLAKTIKGLSYYVVYNEEGKQLVKQRNMEEYSK
ncbi:MAG: FAD:protein FMN transferase [Candidatus Azobacteroides sp.]|nr:FAD:protein FMN transferase [Candidatus Azobacteroides sp.]